MDAEDGTATTNTTQLMGATATGRDMTTRGREMTQQPSKRTNKRTKNNQSGGGTAGEAATRGGVREVLCVRHALLFFYVDLAVCGIRTFNIGIKSTYL